MDHTHRKLIWFVALLVVSFAGAAELVKTRDGIANASIKTIDGIAIASVKTVAGIDATASGGLSKTSLIAWYDMDDDQDAHTGNIDLTEQNAPSYTSGYGIATETDDKGWTVTLSDFHDADQDWTLVCRWQAYSGVASGQYVLSGRATRYYVRYLTAGFTGSISYSVVTGPAASTGNWYCTILEYDATADVITMTVNGTDYTTSEVTWSSSAGDLLIGGDAAARMNNFYIDYLGVFERKLTADEKTWLYNSGGTRTYADF